MSSYLRARFLGKYWKGGYYGPGSWLKFGDRPTPTLPGPEWVRLRPIYSGICASDLAVLKAEANPLLSPWSSFPSVLGHEIMGRTDDVGEVAAAHGIETGQRVAVDPLLPCAVRGLDPCPACARHEHNRCYNFTGLEDPLGPGTMLGFNKELAGGWCESILAHYTQCHPVPDPVSDVAGALTEPLAVGMHAVLRCPPKPGEKALVIGGGSIGLCTLAALRLLDIDCEVVLSARYGFQEEAGRALAGDHVRVEAAMSPLELAQEAAGAQRHKAELGPDLVIGGFDVVYDCVGSNRTVSDAVLRATRAGGTVVIIGGASHHTWFDWTRVWARELNIRGSYVYSYDAAPGETYGPAERPPHTFRRVLDLMARRPDVPVERIVTHRFPLEEVRTALDTANLRSDWKSIKVLLMPNGEPASASSEPLESAGLTKD